MNEITPPSPEQWARVTEIVGSAVELHGEDRRRFVAEACGADDELRATVRSLIEAHDTPGVVADFPEPLSGHPGPLPERVGPYRILDLLGYGGMGTVYLAVRQGPGFTQRVALKVMRAGFADAAVTHRLAIERQILARLEHPNIARFIDGGTTDAGQPYVAMEYVEGTGLTAYCEQQHSSIVRRVQLFLEVCDAVHYAHQQLVVHRDLKPGNILVTADGRPRLLDFGIAKLLDHEAEPGTDTRSTVWCTPAYASPEQVRSEAVTTLSDVYSLGVVLYELLTGALPYAIDGRSPAAMARVVSEVEPVRPSTRVESPRVARVLRGDLDTIVLKALEKEPDRRYGSAHELAEDLRRYLDRKPVHARPARLGYRMSKFIRRNRYAVTAGAVIAALLLGGILATSWQASVAGRERSRAEGALARSESVADFIIGLFSMDDLSVDAAAKRAMLDRGLREAESLSDQPDAQAATYDALGQAYANLGQYQPAADLLTRAYEIRHRLHPSGHVDVAASLNRLALGVQRLGNADSTERLYRGALAMSRSLGPEAREVYLEALVNLGRVARGEGRLEEADSILEQAFDYSTATFGRGAEQTLQVMHQQAMAARSRGTYRDAERLFRGIIAIRQDSFGPDDVGAAEAMFFQGDVLLELEEPDSAEARYREGIRIIEATSGLYDLGLIHGLHSLGSLLAAHGDPGEAVAVVRRSTSILESHYGPRNITTARGKEILGRVLQQTGRLAEAESVFIEVVAEKTAALGEWTVPPVLENLSRLTMRRGDLAAAAEYAERSLAIRREMGERPGLLIESLMQAAEVHRRRGELGRAEAELREAVSLAEGLETDDPARRDAYRVLAEFLAQTGRSLDAGHR